MKRLLLPILLGTLLGLGLAMVWLGPTWWFDPEHYRARITAALAETLGRPVEIEGRVSFDLLPRPRLTMRGVRLTGEPSALLEVAAVEATLEPLALLDGRAAVIRLELDHPILAAATLAEEAAGWARRGAAGLGLQQIVVREGVVVRRDEDRSPLLTGLQAEIEAAAVGGPYRLHGSADWWSSREPPGGADVPLRFDGSLGLPTETAMPVSLVVRVRDTKAEAKLSGQLGSETLHGKLSISGDNLDELLRRFDVGGGLPSVGKADFSLQAVIDAGGDVLRLESLDSRIGNSRATGIVTLALGETPRGAVTLSFANLDMDEWLTGAPSPVGFTPWRQMLRAMPLTLDVSADVLTVRKSVLRQVRIAAKIDNEVLQLDQVTALLPGNSVVMGSGGADWGTATPRFDLHFEASSDNLRAVFDWLGVAAAQVPPDRLRVLTASGHLAGTARELSLSDLQLRIDTSEISGAATLRFGDRLSVGINLASPVLNLDSYWRRGAAAVDWTSLRGALAGFDANVRTSIGLLTVADTPIRDLLIDGTLINGEVNFRQALSSDLAGMALRLEGRIDGLARGEPELHGLRYSLGVIDPDRLARLLDLALPLPADRLGRVAASGRLDGDAHRLSFESQGEAAGAALTLSGLVLDLGHAPRWTAKLSARHDSLIALVRLLVPDYQPLGNPGGFVLETALDGTATELVAAPLHAQLGPVTLDGQAHLTLFDQPEISADLSASAIDVNAFLMRRSVGRGWSRDALDLGWMRGIRGMVTVAAPSLTYDRQRLDQPALRLRLQDGAADLEQLTASVGDGRLTAHGRLSAGGAAELEADLLEARLSVPLFRLGGIEVTGGRINGQMRLATEGRSPFEMLSRLSGSGHLEIRDGVLSGFSLGEVSHRLAKVSRPGDMRSVLQAAMTQGRTPFSQLSGQFAITSGVVGTEDLALEGEGGTASAVITASLPAATVDARAVFRLTDQPQAPGFVMTLDGILDVPHRGFDASDLEAWAAQREAAAPEQAPAPPPAAPPH